MKLRLVGLATVVLIGVATSEREARAINGTPTWTFSLVQTGAPVTYMSSPSFAFDHYGTPSVTWTALPQSGGNSTVMHSQFTGLGMWSHRSVTTASGAGQESAITFDRAERPALAWVNSSGAVEGQFNNGTIQAFGVNAATGNTALSLTTDLAGNIRGAYAGSTPGAIYDIKLTGTTFSSTNIVNFSNVNILNDLRMTTDNHGLRHVAAAVRFNGSTWGVQVASEPQFGGPWATATFATGDAIDGVDIQTDPADGRLALAYTRFQAGTNQSSLVYAKFNGISFDTTTVLSSTTTVFKDISLAFDRSDGRPAIAYEELLNTSAQRLSFAYKNASSVWQTSLVDDTILLDSPLGLPRRPSLAFDDYGTSWPAISYVDANESLMVAFDPPGVPEPTSLLLWIGALLLTRQRQARVRL